MGTPFAPGAGPQTPIYPISSRSTYLRLDRKGPGDDGLYMAAVPWAILKFGGKTNVIRAWDYRHDITDPEFTTA